MSLPKVTGLHAHKAMTHLAHLISQEPPVLSPEQLREAKQRLLWGFIDLNTKGVFVTPHESLPGAVTVYGYGKWCEVATEAILDLKNFGTDTGPAVLRSLFEAGVLQGAQDLLSLRDQLSLMRAADANE